MRVLLLTADAAGVSHSSDAGAPLSAGAFAPPAPISAPEPCAALLYLILPAG